MTWCLFGARRFFDTCITWNRGCFCLQFSLSCPAFLVRGTHFVASWDTGRPSVPEEVDLNGSSLEALAKWRGAVTTAGRRRGAVSGGITKKLSTNGNNLTKYWGAPVSKKSPSRPARPEDVESSSTERRFKIMDTTNPETPTRGSGTIEAKCKSSRGHVAKEEVRVNKASRLNGVLCM